MPIGFWAVSRQDVKDVARFYLDDYHKKSVVPTDKEIDRLVRQVKEKLDDTFRDMMIDFGAEHSQ